MPEAESARKVVSSPESTGRKPSSNERIWGRSVMAYGYAGIPSILIQGQSRLGISPLQMNIIIQLLDYWHDPERRPFPTKKILRTGSMLPPRPFKRTSVNLSKRG
jgi:hypothetical protein